MLRMTIVALALLVMVPVARAQDGQKADTPEAKYKELVDQFDKLEKELIEAYQSGSSRDELMELQKKAQDAVEKISTDLFQLAEDHDKDPIAVDALVWVVEHSFGSSKATKAAKILTEKHLTSEKIGPLCEMAMFVPIVNQDQLRAIIKDNPSNSVKGQASLALAKQLVENEKTQAEAEKLFETMIEKYSDVETRMGPLGKMAEDELYILRNLAIGRVAPDIVGKDLDGVEFKLSDYRGKVILLDFWGDW